MPKPSQKPVPTPVYKSDSYTRARLNMGKIHLPQSLQTCRKTRVRRAAPLPVAQAHERAQPQSIRRENSRQRIETRGPSIFLPRRKTKHLAPYHGPATIQRKVDGRDRQYHLTYNRKSFKRDVSMLVPEKEMQRINPETHDPTITHSTRSGETFPPRKRKVIS